MANTPKENYNEYSKQAHFIRGKLIDDCVLIERLIDEFICRHFCSQEEKKEEMMNVILGSEAVNFRQKAEILKHILQNHKNTILLEYPKIIKDLTEAVIPMRNKLAHYLLDGSAETFENTIPGGLILIKFKNKRFREVFPPKSLNQFSDKLKAISKVLANALK